MQSYNINLQTTKFPKILQFFLDTMNTRDGFGEVNDFKYHYKSPRGKRF